MKTSSGVSLAIDSTDARHHGIRWITIVPFTVLHLGAIAAPFFFTWPALLTAVILYWLSISVGLAMGYHRLLTHRSYSVPKAVEYVLTVFGTLAMQGGPIPWVSRHRLHHHFSDTDHDPHSPRKGWLWGHIGWMLVQAHSDRVAGACAGYGKDLQKDRFYVWLTRYNHLPQAILAVLLLLLGGFPLLIWGIFLRAAVGLHATLLVNSASHLWGRRRFQTSDDSRNNWWVAVLTFGEGWHNNHHAFPKSARHGLKWHEPDLTYLLIHILQIFGVATSVHSVSRTRDASAER